MIEYIGWAFTALVVLAAMQDMWQLKISNAFPVLLAILYVAWVSLVGFESDMWQNLVMFLLVFGVGLFLFARDWLGGGDVKLLMAIVLWFDFAGGGALILSTLIGGGFVAILFIIVRRMLPTPADGKPLLPSLEKKGPIPYGLAIAAGAILAAQVNGFNPSNQLDTSIFDLKGKAPVAMPVR